VGKVSRRQVMMVTVDGEPFRLRFVLYHEDASLEPRILSKARCAPDERPEGPVTRDRRPTVVIVDSGAEAEVLVFPPDDAVAEGTRFSYRGTTWVVIGRRRDSRVLVAEPASH
jgi:hypothetical protein